MWLPTATNPKFTNENFKWILHHFIMTRDDGCSNEKNDFVCVILNESQLMSTPMMVGLLDASDAEMVEEEG
ncbi:unnamed protein product [Linum trigynum]|uniref:Uncharacterized protein n=1 Tax=Linum trigynum TaxID=586398 RepID=A0AAV2DF23_9ROSI